MASENIEELLFFDTFSHDTSEVRVNVPECVSSSKCEFLNISFGYLPVKRFNL